MGTPGECHPGPAESLIEDTYTYDALNRLSTVSESSLNIAGGGSWTPQFAQGNSYDQHGNRTIDAGQTWGTGINNKQFTVTESNNRLGVPSGQSGTMTYNSVGNLITDTYSGAAVTRVYDAENHMVSETQASGYGLSYTQTFGYDELNRLTTSQEGASWSQTNSYDQYGNRSVVGGALSFTASNNRITGWSYDAAGNLLNDGAHGYTFDVENKISKVDGVSAYVYDGDGQRVRKLVNENLRFIYGIGGQQIAEFDGSSGALKKEYIYGASGLLATIEPTAVNANGTRYTTSDHLGSPRVVTNSAAGVASRHDYMPFGEELFNGGRTFGMGYGTTDGIRQKFTSKERDNETGLDFFIARYYGPTAGRFMSVDPLAGNTEDPQTLNRYVYTRNNPLKYIDPEGLDFWIKGQDDYCKEKGTCDKDGYVVDGKGNRVTVTNGQIRNRAGSICFTCEKGEYTANVNEAGVQITNGLAGVKLD